jgi:hypothetical protein
MPLEMPRYADTAWDAFCVASLCPARQVAADLSNLVERANWVLSHPAEARRVAARALTYANCFLTREYVRRYMARQLLAASVCAEECFADRKRCAACQTGNGSRFQHVRRWLSIAPFDDLRVSTLRALARAVTTARQARTAVRSRLAGAQAFRHFAWVQGTLSDECARLIT